MNRERQLSRVN